ncbi:vacuolar sorting protein [Aureococcus anophagefferens]|uniref:Vacuolar sorting protein n=1 Tax=Aureococcus anophagefferens TaxID=44056 RepID=A0ABR1G401_AURAN
MADSPLDETAFAALVRDATDEDLPALACARGADDAWRVARSGLLLTSYTDDGGARKWAYRYAALRVGDGGARELAVFASAASRAVESAAALRLGEKTARPFSLPESGRWGGGGFAVQCAAGEPERFWRAVDEGDGCGGALGAQRRANARGGGRRGPRRPAALLARRRRRRVLARALLRAPARRARRASELPPRPAAARSWRDHEVHALGDLAAVHLRRRDDLETPGFELADGGGRLFARAADDSARRARVARAPLARAARRICATPTPRRRRPRRTTRPTRRAPPRRRRPSPLRRRRRRGARARAGARRARAAGAGAGLTVALAAGTLVGAAGAAVGRSPTHTAAYIATLARSYSKADAPAPPPPDLPKIPPVDDGDVVAEVDVDVRSGGADDALPPTLKIDGDADGDDDGSDDEGGRLLEAPVVVVARLGDAVAASRVVARSSQLGRLRLSATFRATSARDRLLLELRAQSSSADPAGGALLGRRTLSLYELAERDADRRLAAVKETMDGALRCLAGAEPAPPAPSDSDSDDDPASHASFHRFARPAARAAEARTGAGWYALLADEDAAAAGEEEVEGGSAFVDGATDDASGLRRGNVAALVEARVAVSRRAPAAFLDAARRAKDRPPRDDAPSPAATVELLKRLFVVVAWVQGLVSAVDRLLRWDDAAASGGAVAVCLAACLLWARDHFLALPVLLCVCGLGALGLQRLEGDWARRLGEAGDRGRGRAATSPCSAWRCSASTASSPTPAATRGPACGSGMRAAPTPSRPPRRAAAPRARRLRGGARARGRAGRGRPAGGRAARLPRRRRRRRGERRGPGAAARRRRRRQALEPVAADVAGDGRRLVRSWAWDRLAEVEDPRRDATAAPEAAAFAAAAAVDVAPRGRPGSRGGHEAERLVQWATGRPSPVAPPAARTPGPAPDDDRDAAEARRRRSRWTRRRRQRQRAAAATPAAADDAPAAPEPTAADLATVARRRARASSVADAPPDGDARIGRAALAPRARRDDAGVGRARAPRAAARRRRRRRRAARARRLGQGDGRTTAATAASPVADAGPGRTLLGVAEVPLGAVAAAGGDDGLPGFLEPGGWLRCAAARAAAGRRTARRAADARDDVSDDDGGYASADGDDAPAAPPRAQLRCRLELLGDARAAAFGIWTPRGRARGGLRRGPARRRRRRAGRRRRRRRRGHGAAVAVPLRARGAVEIQNSLKDAVRLGEQATAPRRPRPATGPRGGPAPRGVLRARGRPRRARLDDATPDAASPRAAGGRGGARPPSQPATVWQRLLALLEALPCEPELEQLFSQRRKARDWRRDRRSAARRLGAAWAGPLWRRSTAWRRHFAAVRGPELQFWYSAQHALSGVTPVLVVSLGDARLVDDALASDNLPVLTLHAPLKSKPDVHREWRLAAAHHRDARALQRCICDRADDSRAAAAADAPATPPPEVKKGL